MDDAMPLEQDMDYEAQDAVEIVFPDDAMGGEVAYRRWTGEGDWVHEGKLYTPGSIVARGEIRIGEELATATSVTIAVIGDDDRDLFLSGTAGDPGPAPCRIIELWRRRRAGGPWQAWVVDGIHSGKLSSASYGEDGTLTFDIQRVFDDVWRGVPLRWTGTDQRRRYPDDSGLDRADRIRRSGLVIAST